MRISHQLYMAISFAEFQAITTNNPIITIYEFSKGFNVSYLSVFHKIKMLGRAAKIGN